MKVLILSCNTGGGHNAAAQAIAEAIREHGDCAEVLDYLCLAGNGVSKLVGDGYVEVVKKAPAVFGMAYKLGMAVSKMMKKSPVYYANARMARYLEEYLQKNPVDAIVMQSMAPEYPIIKAEKVEPEVYRVINAILETEQSDITVAQAYLQIVLARCIGKLNLVEKSNVGSNDLIYQTVSYISANFKKKFSLEEMAKDLGVSKYVLSRLFSKTFHRNFNQYLNDARLNYACQRLENTSDSITNICLYSGFESQRTFNRVFKERYKISPSDYRSSCVKEMLS